MLRNTVALLLLCLHSLIGWADDGMPTSSLIQSVSERLTVANVTRGEFTQERHLKALSRPLISQGNFVYHRQLGVRWAVIKPFASTMIVTPSGGFYQGKQAQPLTAGFGQLLLALLALDAEKLDQKFEVSGDLKADEWQLIFKPRQSQWQQTITKIQMHGSKSVDQVEVFEASGDRVLLQFVNILYQPALSDQERRELTDNSYFQE